MSIEVAAVLGSAICGLISFFFGFSVGRWAKSRAFRSSVLERDVQRIVVNPRSDNPRTFVPESENAKLREQYEAVFADYRSEVAKLRGLARDYERCSVHADCDGCEYDGTTNTHCPLSPCFPDADELRELGVEVD